MVGGIRKDISRISLHSMGVSKRYHGYHTWYGVQNMSKYGINSNPTLHGGGHNGPPYQLWSLTAPTGRFSLVQSSCKFGHMDTNYDQDPKNVSKCLKCLSYASCDKMIKKSPSKVGLSQFSEQFQEISL